MSLLDELRPISASAEATLIGERMPLVHFPASAPLHRWKDWEGFRSSSMRGETPPGDGMFGDLRSKHVFVYAGPCCFARPDHVGDAVMYFTPGSEVGAAGAAAPFDSGALEDPDARLQSWASQPIEERWALLEDHSCELDGWRDRFAKWLTHCYDAPDRYVETTDDRYADACPERTIPGELREHNGVLGRDLHGQPRCSDRRAWTWELRFREPVPYEGAMLIHCTFEAAEAASDLRDRLIFHGTNLRYEILDKAELLLPSSPAEMFYLESGRIIREVMAT